VICENMRASNCIIVEVLENGVRKLIYHTEHVDVHSGSFGESRRYQSHHFLDLWWWLCDDWERETKIGR
jgi:hypothetical protein